MPEKKLFRPKDYRVYAPRDLSKRWFVEYYIDGKRIRTEKGINKYKTAKRRMTAAQRLIKDLKREFRSFRHQSSTEKAISDYLEANKGGWKKSTYQEYQSILTHFLDWLNAREISEERLRSYLNESKIRLHASTWNKYRTVLKKTLTEIGCPDWFDLIPTQSTQQTPLRYFQKYQIEALASKILVDDPELWLFVQFLYYTFIRPIELRGLKAGDVMLDAQEIRVPAEIAKNKKTQFVAIPKVFLPELEFLKTVPPGRLIFLGEDEKPLSKNAMYRRHKKVLDALGFGKGYSLYSWKHTGGVMLAKKGISIKEIQLQMRHHSLDQTDQYLRQLGIRDVTMLRTEFPPLLA